MSHVGPYAPATAQAQADAMRDACAAGRCRYRDPARARQSCERDFTAECAGYTAHLYLEHGEPVLRWARCARFTAWWQAEKTRVERQRLDTTRKRPARAQWGEE